MKPSLVTEKHKVSFKLHINNEPICIIMRAPPGAGKSYKVRCVIAKFGGDDNHVFSADKFFDQLAKQEFLKRHGRKPDSEELKVAYGKVWRPGLLGIAHRQCLKDFQAAIDLGITPVFLDNTNTRRDQFKKHFKYADTNGYKVRIEEPDSPWWIEARGDLGFFKVKNSPKLQKLLKELLKHGTHGVPEETLLRLIDDTWQNIPGGTGKYVKYNQVFTDT